MTTTKRILGVVPPLLGLLFFLPSVSAYSGVDAMPLPMFVLFLVIGIILIVAGMSSGLKYLAVVGVVITFLLGGIIEEGTLGISVTTTINETGDTTIVQNYEGYTDTNTHLLGFLLMTLSAVMFVSIMVGGTDEI